MKIIERGKIHHYQFKFKCGKCKSILQARLDELKSAGSQYNTAYYSFICPVCETKQYVGSDEWTRIEVVDE